MVQGKGSNTLIIGVVVLVIIVIAAIFLLMQHPQSSSNITTSQPSQLSTVDLIISNNQNLGTGSDFQQMVTFNPSNYSRYEAQNLGNIRFYQGSTELYSWCESGCTSSSQQAVFWVKLPGGVPASSNVSATIVFEPAGTNYDGIYAGESPEQSVTYAQYDNGANVFAYYSNFAGPSTPSGWSSQPNGGTITINNGAYLAGGHAHLISDWPISAGVVEMYLVSENTNNGNDWILTSGNSTQNYNYIACGVGYQNQISGGGTQGGYGLNIQNNGGGTPSIVASANPSPYFPTIIGVYGANLYANYSAVANSSNGCVIPNSIFGSTYLQMAAETGVGSANFRFDWVRIRAEPPNGVMPSVSLS